jgi:hypothetical protein
MRGKWYTKRVKMNRLSHPKPVRTVLRAAVFRNPDR